MPLFEVAILEKPTKKGNYEGEEERLILGPIAVVAADEQAAHTVAIAKSEVDLSKVKASRMEVIVRPFVE